MNRTSYTKVKISDFLTERQGRYKPDDVKIAVYKRLEKIDFSGTIHISEKPTKTDMILVYPGDLVISGINVAKGAVAVYQGQEPVCATIHYSSYIFDDKKVDLEYFKYFVKSPSFVSALQQQVKGGIKTEIKPKHLLPLEITIPNLETQRQIVKQVSENFKRLEELNEEIESQETYTKRLRQNILQNAIEGKLTVEWRKTHTLEKGNPDFDVEALFEQVQKEKKYDRKQKTLAPITEEEMPFEIPNSWKWVRLGEIINEPPKNGYSPKSVNFATSTKTLKLGAVTYGIFNPNEYKYINEIIPRDSCYWLKNGDFLIERSNSHEYVGICAIYDGKDNEFIYPDLLMKFRVNELLSEKLIHKILISSFSRKYFMSKAKGAQKTMPKINQETVVNAMLPLPPLAEQKEIVAKIESLLSKVTELEEQIQERKKLSGLLMQSVLKNAFAPQE
ncbi:restriction endonuclease subunit S [uncultured Treponema sp.]|uniref:restriction endonuclease subunit S n=1 Tax=uncultured Treponema sp. TaxID=162155 RepID=UPI0025CF82DC|nr:restriction endonuclease subunit S [uncultured Treponema sp.]